MKLLEKKIGNDIVTNKKTFLLIKALEKANGDDLNYLKEIFSKPTENEEIKIKKVKSIFVKFEIDKIAKNKMEEYYNKALKNLDNIKNSIPNKKHLLYDFAEYVLKRKK